MRGNIFTYGVTWLMLAATSMTPPIPEPSQIEVTFLEEILTIVNNAQSQGARAVVEKINNSPWLARITSSESHITYLATMKKIFENNPDQPTSQEMTDLNMEAKDLDAKVEEWLRDKEKPKTGNILPVQKGILLCDIARSAIKMADIKPIQKQQLEQVISTMNTTTENNSGLIIGPITLEALEKLKKELNN